MKVYVITSGEYSDYGILAVATDYDEAVRKMIKFSPTYGGARIEEYDTEDDAYRGHDAPKDKAFDVRYDFQNKQFLVGTSVTDYFTLYYKPKSYYRDNEFFLAEGVHAKDEQGAIKIAADYMARCRAEAILD